MATGCEKPGKIIPSDDDQKGQNTETIEYSEYSLTQCHWNKSNLTHDSVYIINSQDEFLKFISCEGETTPMPVVDFNEYSLLFAYGFTTSGVSSVTKTLQQLSDRKYELNIEVILNMTTYPEGWIVAILTPKLFQSSIITSNKVDNVLINN
jgi:hypothetical protein